MQCLNKPFWLLWIHLMPIKKSKRGKRIWVTINCRHNQITGGALWGWLVFKMLPVVPWNNTETQNHGWLCLEVSTRFLLWPLLNIHFQIQLSLSIGAFSLPHSCGIFRKVYFQSRDEKKEEITNILPEYNVDMKSVTDQRAGGFIRSLWQSNYLTTMK